MISKSSLTAVLWWLCGFCKSIAHLHNLYAVLLFSCDLPSNMFTWVTEHHKIKHFIKHVILLYNCSSTTYISYQFPTFIIAWCLQTSIIMAVKGLIYIWGISSFLTYGLSLIFWNIHSFPYLWRLPLLIYLHWWKWYCWRPNQHI